MSQRERASQRAPAALAVAHVADFYRRYPGDTVTFYTRVEIEKNLPGFRLRISLPPGLELGDYRVVDEPNHTLPLVTWDSGTNHLTWAIERDPGSAGCYEFQVQATVSATHEDRNLSTRAVASAEDAGGSTFRDEATATIAVAARGQYLKYLPSIYQDDELMGRFLMLFESFWGPIEDQIDNLHLYFDPQMAPPELLPWLATWLDLILDESWPEQRRRVLLRSAASLFRRRGTRRGLQEYLEIYTGQQPKIVERRAYNFRLGQEARLGPAIALGTGNVPHTFAVELTLPALSSDGSRDNQTRQEMQRRNKIEGIIESEKPAHTAYDLRLEIELE